MLQETLPVQFTQFVDESCKGCLSFFSRRPGPDAILCTAQLLEMALHTLDNTHLAFELDKKIELLKDQKLRLAFKSVILFDTLVEHRDHHSELSATITPRLG